MFYYPSDSEGNNSSRVCRGEKKALYYRLIRNFIFFRLLYVNSPPPDQYFVYLSFSHISKYSKYSMFINVYQNILSLDTFLIAIHNTTRNNRKMSNTIVWIITRVINSLICHENSLQSKHCVYTCWVQSSSWGKK